jgi:hypothetical protein
MPFRSESLIVGEVDNALRYEVGTAANLKLAPASHAYQVGFAMATRKMLIPERLWHQKNADTKKVLAPEKC